MLFIYLLLLTYIYEFNLIYENSILLSLHLKTWDVCFSFLSFKIFVVLEF